MLDERFPVKIAPRQHFGSSTMPSYIKQPLNLLLLVVIFFLMVLVMTRDTTTIDGTRTSDKTRTKGFPREEVDPKKLILTKKGMISYGEAQASVFGPMGFKIVEDNIIPALSYIDPPKCSNVFEEWLAGSASQNESGTPPRDIPPKLLDQYTLNGYANLVMGYADDRSGTHQAEWNKEVIDEYANKKVPDFVNYGGEGRAVYHAMKAYGIKDQSGLVIGSLSPWVEAFVIKLGAAKLKTIEYTRISTPSQYPWLTYAHPLEIAKNYEKHVGAYDFVVTFSSIEHSGLGRFGDALDPNGDLKEARKIHCMLKEGGLLFMGVQTGKDAVYWNLHRGYGRLRLAMMAAGFDIVDSFYFDERILITPQFFIEKDGAQPVLVLRKRYSSDISLIKSKGQ